MISAELSFNIGDFFNGEKRGFGIDGSFKPNGRFSLESLFLFDHVTLPSDAFNAIIFCGRVNYAFSTTLFAKLFAQWNSDSDVISTNFLLNYTYRPSSNFFLVFNQIYDGSGERVELAESTLVGKITYWWNP